MVCLVFEPCLQEHGPKVGEAPHAVSGVHPTTVVPWPVARITRPGPQMKKPRSRMREQGSTNPMLQLIAVISGPVAIDCSDLRIMLPPIAVILAPLETDCNDLRTLHSTDRRSLKGGFQRKGSGAYPQKGSFHRQAPRKTPILRLSQRTRSTFPPRPTRPRLTTQSLGTFREIGSQAT